jgi:hypothetical protein
VRMIALILRFRLRGPRRARPSAFVSSRDAQ